MKTKKKLVFVMAVLAVFCMVFTACGKPSTLEAMYDSDKDFKSEMQKLEKQNKGLKIIIKENTVTYDYDVVEAGLGSESLLTSDAMKTQLKSMLDKQGDAQFKPLIKQIEEETKITGVKMEVNFRAGDTVLANKTFENK